jgi:hypothetical protein
VLVRTIDVVRVLLTVRVRIIRTALVDVIFLFYNIQSMVSLPDSVVRIRLNAWPCCYSTMLDHDDGCCLRGTSWQQTTKDGYKNSDTDQVCVIEKH